jgi:hypothetical protein
MDSTKPMAKVSDHVCEDIDSTMEWVKEAGVGSLLVHLTGDISLIHALFSDSGHLFLFMIICLL